MENDIRFKITNYFSLPKDERDELIIELSNFYYNRWINLDTEEKFEFTINELMFRLELEYKLALKHEEYNRVEIYQKLGRIFHSLKEKFMEDGRV